METRVSTVGCREWTHCVPEPLDGPCSRGEGHRWGPVPQHRRVCVSDQLRKPGSGFEKPPATPGDGLSPSIYHRLPAGVRVQQSFRSGWQCECPLCIGFQGSALC